MDGQPFSLKRIIDELDELIIGIYNAGKKNYKKYPRI